MISLSLKDLCRNGKRAPTSGNLDFLILGRFWTKLAKVWDQAGGIFIEVPDPARSLPGSHGVATDNPAYQSSLVELGKKLLACARDGDTEGVRSLMARGAPFTTDWLGTSPLHLAAQYGNQATADVLLRAGISRDARTKVDKTPLHVASSEGHTEIVEMLLQNGADVDARDMLRMTPLHWAVERGNISTVEMLLRHGSNTNIESKFDKTALEIASDNGRPDIFEMLQNAEQFRIVTIDNGENDAASMHAPTSMADDNGMVHISVSQQEEVATAAHQIELDPVQIALNSAAETIVSGPMVTQVQDSIVHQNSYNGLSLDEGIATSRQEVDAIKLLEAHGITMLPEDDQIDPLQAVTASQTLTLTEAGKLALSLSSPVIKPTVTKVVTLNSNSMRSPLSRMALPVVSSPVPQKKQPRVIKLTPEQFAALKSGKSGQIVLSGAGGRKRETITLASPQPRKVTRVSSASEEEGDMKVDLEKQELKQQLLKKLEEAENFKKELKKREEEAERLQLQLQALS